MGERQALGRESVCKAGIGADLVELVDGALATEADLLAHARAQLAGFQRPKKVVIGELQWNLQLPWQVVVFHVAVAGLVWGVGVAALWRLARPVTSASAPD